MNEIVRANLRFHGRRYVATGVAVMIATAFVIAALSLGNGAGAAARSMFADSYAGAAVVVTAADDDTLDPEIVSDIDAVPGVESAAASVVGYLEMNFDGVTVGGAVSALPDNFGLQDYSQGRAPENNNEIAISAQTAKALRAGVGDTLRADSRALSIVGIFGSDKSASFVHSSGSARMAPGALTSDQSWVTNILVASTEGSSVDEAQQSALAEEVQSALGSKYVVKTVDDVVEEGLAAITSSTTQMNTMLMIFPLIAVAVAVIVISTTFQVVVQQRQREMALLRCLGAGSGQVRNLVLGEAFIVGAIGSFLGVIAGTFLSAWGLTATGLVPTYGAALAAIGVPAMIVVFILGVLVTVIAGAKPALRSGKIAPIAALQESGAAVTARTSGWWVRLIVGGMLTLLSGLAMLFAAARQSEAGLLLAMLFGFICLISAIIFLSAVFPWLVRLVASPWRSMLARMAAGNSARNPGRTAATGTSIVIGVTLITMMMVGATSIRATMDTNLDKSMPVDVEISADQGALSTSQIEALEKLGGLKESAVVQGYDNATLGGESVKVLDGAAYAQVPRTAITVPGAGEAFVGWAFSNGTSYQLCNGDKCTEVTAVAKPWVGNDVFVSPETLGELGTPSDMAFVAQMSNTKDVQVLGADIQRIGNDLEVSGAAPMRAQFDTIINIILLVVVSLLGVSVLVALVGVSNTLSLSVAERTRENGLLRALGMSRGQVSRMLTLEAIFIAVTGALTGIVLGTFFGVSGMYALPLGTDSTIIAIPWWQLAVVIAVAILAAVLASWLPGRRAARTSPVEALATE